MSGNKIDFIKKWADNNLKPIVLTEEEMDAYERLCAGEELDSDQYSHSLSEYLIKNKKFLIRYAPTWKLVPDPVIDNTCDDSLIEKIINQLYIYIYHLGDVNYDHDDIHNYSDIHNLSVTVLNRIILKQNTLLILDDLSEKLTDIIGRQCVCHKNNVGIDCFMF